VINFKPPFTVLAYNNRKVVDRFIAKTEKDMDILREILVENSIPYVVVANDQSPPQIENNGGLGSGSES
jgi:hypothetical protein